MLPRAGFGNDSLLAHAQRKQGLTQGVVDFVRASMVEVLPLQPDAGAAVNTAVMGSKTLSFV